MNETKSGARLRAEAAKAVNAVVAQGRSLDAVLGELDEKINPADRPLLKMLCYGTLRHHFRLRADLRKLLERPLKRGTVLLNRCLPSGYSS